MADEERSLNTIRLLLEAVPADREPELLQEFGRAAASGRRSEVCDAIVRWIGIGDFYTDNGQNTPHPLAPLAGSFKDDPELERLAEQIALTRREARS